MQKFMFDTNAFSSLLDSKVNWVDFFENHKCDYEFLVTSIQIEELATIPDDKIESRIVHLLCLCCMNVKLVPTIAVVGHSRLGLCVVARDNNMYSKLLNENKSNVNDAMIGDAAFREKCTLVTDDKGFIKKLNANGIKTVTFQEFYKIVCQEV